MNKFLFALVLLDAYLTEKPAVAHHNAAQGNYPETAEDMMNLSDAVYLSDGGLSRLILTEKGDLLYTDNSLAKVKERWHHLQAEDLRRIIEREARKVLESYAALTTAESKAPQMGSALPLSDAEI